MTHYGRLITRCIDIKKVDNTRKVNRQILFETRSVCPGASPGMGGYTLTYPRNPEAVQLLTLGIEAAKKNYFFIGPATKALPPPLL